MKEIWQEGGADWSNESIERELKKVEKTGELLANKFYANKLVLLGVVIAALIVSVMFLKPYTALAVELVVLFVVSGYMKKTMKRAQAPLYHMCDPYLEFAYIRAYARKPLPRTKQAVTRQALSLAQCMVMAGEPQAAIAIQRAITEPERLKVAEKTIYYNTLLNCYGQFGWNEKRLALGAELRRMRAQAGKLEGMQLDVILRLEELKRKEEEGDIDFVLDYFVKNPAVFRFQEVAKRYALAMLYIRAGDASSAREHVEYVLKYGNKLYYKKKLEDYLRSSLEEE